MERLEKMPADKVKRFFLKGSGNNAGSARVRKELREHDHLPPAQPAG